MDYDYYCSVYFGSTIAESDWARLERQAGGFIDEITFCRLKRGAEVTDDVKMAVCAVAEAVQKQENDLASISTGVQSENADGYSVSYQDFSTLSVQCFHEKLEAANLYLSEGDPLRYRGV